MDRLGRERILFVCTANVNRSRTAQDPYARDPRLDVEDRWRRGAPSSWACC